VNVSVAQGDRRVAPDDAPPEPLKVTLSEMIASKG
jgi:hypothetical protein